MSAALTTKIPIRDRSGRVVDEKTVCTYPGLLAQAHAEGLSSIETELVQAPSDTNGFTAIVRAKVTTAKGAFTGLGDASPDNVNRKIVPHLLRMAETRAKARALRDAVNIGTVALEELGGDEPGPDNVRPLRRERRRGMSREQKRELYKLILRDGHEPDDAKAVLLRAAGVGRVEDITGSMADDLIRGWGGQLGA